MKPIEVRFLSGWDEELPQGTSALEVERVLRQQILARGDETASTYVPRTPRGLSRSLMTTLSYRGLYYLAGIWSFVNDEVAEVELVVLAEEQKEFEEPPEDDFS